jgi:medium-chain acyl-[acyl-carrier-protein] hydrolase
LLCFAHAGGGTAVYRGWRNQVPPALSVCPVLLPGRENRLHEARCTRLEQVIEALLTVMATLQDKPFAFYGHSLGALIAFEFARALRRCGMPGPERLFLSGMGAPQAPRRRRPMSELPAAELLDMLAALYDGGVPAEILEEPDMMALEVNILRADLAIFDSYQYQPEGPLDCPISVGVGQEDASVSLVDARAWQQLTSAPMTLRTFPGGHLFVNTAGDQILEMVQQDLFGSRTADRRTCEENT